MSDIETIFAEIMAERAYQDAKWGGAEHDSGHNVLDWARFISEYVDKLVKDKDSGYPVGHMRHRFVQIAALACAALQHCPDLQPTAGSGEGATDGEV